MLEDKDKLKKMRDENQEKGKQFFRRSRLSKQERDEININIKKLKKQRKEYFKARDNKVTIKKQILDELNDSDDNKQKKQLYEKLKLVKKELYECQIQANTAHDEVQELAQLSQEHHIEMKTYIQMGKQVFGIADDLHLEVVNISKKIMKLFEARDDLRGK